MTKETRHYLTFSVSSYRTVGELVEALKPYLDKEIFYATDEQDFQISWLEPETLAEKVARERREAASKDGRYKQYLSLKEEFGNE